MGLEAVDIVMELEDEFGVKLPDAECSRVRTVADLAALVLAHCSDRSHPCPTSKRFYALRRAHRVHSQAGPRTFRPCAMLADVFPKGPGRMRAWSALRDTDPYIPALRPSDPADAALLLLTVFALVGAFASCMLTASSVGWVAASALGVFWLITFAALAPTIQHACSREFPQGCTTVADLIRSSMPPEIPTEQGKRLAFEQGILERTRVILSEQLSLPLDRVRAESRLVEDLEID